MIEERNIQDYNFSVPYRNKSFNVRLSVVRLWDDAEEPSCSRFNIQLKLRNSQASNVVNDDFLDGGTWTVVAHSDHNPSGGHDIRDESDSKQLHIDVHPYVTGKGYNRCYSMLSDGSPPAENDEAIRFVREFMIDNAGSIIEKYLDFQR